MLDTTRVRSWVDRKGALEVKTMRFFVPVLLAGCSMVAGCSTETGDHGGGPKGSRERAPIVLDDNAVLAPGKISDSASVEDGKLSFPKTTANQAWADRLRPGMVVAGDRDKSKADLAESKNPYGFLRKVVSVGDGDPIVIVTEPAELPDLLEGDLVFGDGESSIFEDASEDLDDLGTRNIRPLANGGGGSSKGSGKASILGELKAGFGPVVRLSEGTFGLDADFDAELRIRKWWKVPTGIEKASAKLTLNPRASVIIEVGAKVSAQNPSGGGSLVKTWEGPSVPIPLGGPIPVTLRLRPEVTCSVAAGGEITARGRAHLSGRAAAGFTYTDGDMKSLSESPTLTPGFDFIGVQGKASLTGKCTIQAVVSLLAFDAAGLEGKLGPYASLTAEVCGAYGEGGGSGGFTLFEEHGVEADIDGRLQVPGLGQPSINKPIFGFSPLKSEPKYFIGNDKTCDAPQKDSCVGKPNGLYCSEIETSSAYECLDEQIAAGQQCLPGQRCKGPLKGNQIVCE